MRKRHSISSAAKETGIGALLLEQFMVAAGALNKDDPRPVSGKTFEAAFYAELLSEIPTLVSPSGMELAMGATRAQFVSLAADGVLTPRIDVPTIKLPWRVSDGLALVVELKEMAEPVEPSDQHWESIQSAKSRSSISVGTIVAAVRDGRLRLGLRTDVAGYAGFCVLKMDINGMDQSIRLETGHSHVTAAAFGRSVGKRGQSWFKRLSVAGPTPTTHLPHPKWGGMRIYVSPADQAAFHERFMTPSTMAKEADEDRRVIISKLKAAGIASFAPNDEDYGRLYLRSEVEGILAQP
ncbi:hypothetical protein [Octadecabacter antarcticus]|uniref:hypothetical protein n=1 Tax=Octadecabacter antarcticus TaxID=1217908 RepID=UPI00018061BE|nr:hypothetical protein [Octadecabacter antarcticus]